MMVMNCFDLLEVEATVAGVLHVIDMAAGWWFELPLLLTREDDVQTVVVRSPCYSNNNRE